MAVVAYDPTKHKAMYVSPAPGVSVLIVGTPESVEAIIERLRKVQK